MPLPKKTDLLFQRIAVVGLGIILSGMLIIAGCMLYGSVEAWVVGMAFSIMIFGAMIVIITGFASFALNVFGKQP